MTKKEDESKKADKTGASSGGATSDTPSETSSGSGGGNIGRTPPKLITVEYTGIPNPDDTRRRPLGEVQDPVLGLRWILWSNRTPYNATPEQHIPHETKRKRRWRATKENREMLAPFESLDGFKVIGL